MGIRLMGLKTRQNGSVLEHVYDVREIPLLEQTSPKWTLREGEASEVRGVDVITPGRFFQPERGRKPVGTFLPEADRPVSAIAESNADAIVPLRYSTLCFSPTTPVGAVSYECFIISSGDYTSATGRITKTSAFTNYAFRTWDRILIDEILMDERFI